MKIRYIITVFVLISLMKFILSFLDERQYLEMGESFIRTGEFLVDDEKSKLYPPLYPMLISITTFFKPETTFILIKFLNSFLSTSIIFPIYLLSREFMDKKNSFILSLIPVFIPESFVYSYSIMSENLFYPLFLFSIYFFYKYMKVGNKKFQILSGIFVGCSILTRSIGFVLPIGIGLSLSIHFLTHTKKISDTLKYFKNYWLFFLIVLILISPWYLLGRGSSGYIDYIDSNKTLNNNITIMNFLYYLTINIGFLIIGSGLLFSIFFIYMAFKVKGLENFKILCWSIFIILILLSTFWSFTSRTRGIEKKIMGRYMAPLLFLILIMGGIGIKSYEKERNDKILFSSFLICSLILISIPIDIRIGGFDTLSTIFLLVPKQVRALGLISFTIPDLLIKTLLFLTPLTMFLLRRYFSLSNILKFTVVFLLLNTFTATIAMRYASLDAEEFMNFAIWMRDNLGEGKVLFDIRGEGEELELFWTIEAVKFYTDFPTTEDDYTRNGDYMYVISKRELPLTLLKELETEEGIYEKRILKLFLYVNTSNIVRKT